MSKKIIKLLLEMARLMAGCSGGDNHQSLPVVPVFGL